MTTLQEIKKEIDTKKVKRIELLFTDPFGGISEYYVRGNNMVDVLESGGLYDGSSISGFTSINNSDLLLLPDVSTYQRLPWDEETAVVICDVKKPDGSDYDSDPRTILKNTLAIHGLELMVGPEPEFFLLHEDERGPLIVDGKKMAASDKGSYFKDDHATSTAKVRREIADSLEAMGYDIEAEHHEVANGQHEIDWKYDSALKTADATILFKYTVNKIAANNNLRATFMDKPFQGENGSGMHMHLNLAHEGTNLFSDADSATFMLSDMALQFIEGVLSHIEEIVAITNPTVNSYKRLVPGYEAPVYIAYGPKNRSAVIRIPGYSNANAARFELRNPGSSANPYLSYAAILAAGMQGVHGKATPRDYIDRDLYNPDEPLLHDLKTLPSSLEEAIGHFEKSNLMKEVFGTLHAKIVAKRREEIRAYTLHVSQWEVSTYV